jgi:protease-4
MEMVYFVIALVRNLVVLLLRLLLWPLLLLGMVRPVTLRIDLPASPPPQPPGLLSRLLGADVLDMDTLRWLLRRAEKDPVIAGVVLLVPGMSTERTAVSEIREGLEAVRAADKSVTVVLREGGGLQELRVAPPGARVVIHPSMTLQIAGPAAAPVFLGEMLEKVGVKADLFAVGDYKSAPETFTRREMSESNREQLDRLLSALDRSACRQVALGRAVDVEDVQRWKQHGVFTAAEAVESGIVDDARYDHEVLEELGGRSRIATRGDRLLGLRWRLRLVGLRRPRVVAVIPVRGQILSHAGQTPGTRGQAAADRIEPLLRRAGRDPSIKAVVLEIDSRGGSAVASDLIYRRARQVLDAKPVVAYLRDVAASGGYYIASAAGDIVASPDCITGSIGVFGGKIASRGLLPRLGVNMQRMTTGDPGAGMLLPDRPFDEAERGLVMKRMHAVYEAFLEVVAARKDRPREEIEPLSGGRVWSASDARDGGLVDDLGGWRTVLGVLSDRLGQPEERIRTVRLGRPPPLASLSPPAAAGTSIAALLRTAALVRDEGVALELPFAT